MFFSYDEYLILLSMMILGFLISFIMIFASFVLGPHITDIEKVSAYECGFEPFEDSKINFDVHFYLVAILFLIFDLEIAFLFPWIYSLGSFSSGYQIISFNIMLVFLLLLVIGFIYEWKKGALDWN